MALARLILNKALASRASSALVRPAYAAAPATAGSRGGLNPHSLFSSEATDTTTRAPSESEANRRREVAVTDRSAAARRGGGRWAWRDLRDFVPFRLVDGLGSAVSHVAESLSRLAPSRLLLSGKVREDEERYRLRFEVPGLGKEDVRVTVEDGALVIRGEKEEHEGEDGDGEWWSASSYGSYHARLLLPEDARVEGIVAEVKDGVLYVTVPRAAERRSDVTEVEVL